MKITIDEDRWIIVKEGVEYAIEDVANSNGFRITAHNRSFKDLVMKPVVSNVMIITLMDKERLK